MHDFLININKILDLIEPEFIKLIKTNYFESIMPGFSNICGCAQGDIKHLEGDVATHTYLVAVRLRELSLEYPNQFDEIDLLAALIHDFEKPNCQKLKPTGDINFLGHEELAAKRVPEIAQNLRLTTEQEEKLFYLVRYHGEAHSINKQTEAEILSWFNAKYWTNLKFFQQADAESCWFDLEGTEHLPVQRAVFEQLQNNPLFASK